MAKIGVLVRNRGALAFLGRETLFVFDKTGTITEGRFIVHQGINHLNFEQQRTLKGLVAQSNHPISVALNQALLCPPLQFQKIEEVIGKGIKGILDGEHYYLGSFEFLSQQGILFPPSFQSDDKPPENHSLISTVYFANHRFCLGTIRLGDQLKPEIKDFISHLSPLKVLLVSGDGEEAVSTVAKACNITEWKSGFLPGQKKKLIDRLKEKGEIVAMLGDGINDAPALTSAHIGIAVVSATDISIQVSDLLLTTNHFHSLSLLRNIAIQGRKIIRQNLFWAFFYNCVGLALAAAGLMTPLFAAFAMVVSSFIVLLNAQRIVRYE